MWDGSFFDLPLAGKLALIFDDHLCSLRLMHLVSSPKLSALVLTTTKTNLQGLPIFVGEERKPLSL